MFTLVGPQHASDYSSVAQTMVLHLRQIIIRVVLLFAAISSFAQNCSSTHQCNQSCGEERLPYPFGFSDGCPVKLNCSSGSPIIGDFLVLNVTSDQILIKVPSNCSRSVNDLSRLFGKNFAPTSSNLLLLDSCSLPLKDCVIPEKLLPRSKSCNSGAIGDDRHYSCYSEVPPGGTGILSRSKVGQEANCSVLYSSIVVDLNGKGNSSSGRSSVWLEVETMELSWWVEGGCRECHCHPNANCLQNSLERQEGCQCRCKEGFAGDGFTKGKGCSKINGSVSGTSPSGHGVSKICIFIGGTIAGATLVAILFVTCYCIKRRRKSLKSSLSAKHLLSEAAGNSNVPFYTYKEIERATNGFAEKQRLGTGAYGTVYAGKLKSDEWVAIKRIKHRDRDSLEQVMNEIKLVSSVSHPNLVRLLGCCIENGEQILVYEYMPNGTLSQHLQRERGSLLPWTVRLKLAAETARAIAHLHSGVNPPIYHRDIKSSNILLDLDFDSKVADFGLSRFGMMDDSHISTTPQGTPGYVDPQSHQNFHLSDKSDVYSFGVVLAEIITAKKAVDFSRPNTEINLAALAIDRIRKGRVDDMIDPLLELHRDAWTLSSVHKVAELAFRCLAFHRDMRPSMMEVAHELERIRLNGWAPSEENVHAGASVASCCSSPYLGSEKSLNTLASQKVGLGLGSRRSSVRRPAEDGLPQTEEATDDSPVSIHDSWLCEESSPSTNTLLGKVV